jgi:uncharacterized protein (DUF4415 family)
MSKKQPDWKEAKRKALANLEEISDLEDASISADALTDPDNPPADDLLRRRGRPVSPNRKRAIKLRIDPDVIDRFRQSGPGWQSRMNDVLRKAVGL